MAHDQGTGLFPATRLRQVAAAAGNAGLDALLLTPGPDLRYVTGYDAHQLERLTCLVVPAAPAEQMAIRSWSSRGSRYRLPRHPRSGSLTWRSSGGTRQTILTLWSRGGSARWPRSGCQTGCGR